MLESLIRVGIHDRPIQSACDLTTEPLLEFLADRHTQRDATQQQPSPTVDNNKS